MRRYGLLLACLTLTATVAHATEPTAPTTAAPAASSAAPTAAAAANAGAPATAASSTTAPTSAAADQDRVYGGGLTTVEIERAFRKFRKTERDGEVRYCRREAPLGTRLGKQVCYTAEQVLANARAEREAGLMTSQQNVCGRGDCSPGS